MRVLPNKRFAFALGLALTGPRDAGTSEGSGLLPPEPFPYQAAILLLGVFEAAVKAIAFSARIFPPHSANFLLNPLTNDNCLVQRLTALISDYRRKDNGRVGDKG